MKPGDRVKISDEKGVYTVIRSISPKRVLVATDDGLEMPLLKETLIIVSEENEKMYRTSSGKKKESLPNKSAAKGKKSAGNYREVDLHLKGTSGQASDYHAIEIQIIKFRTELDRAIRENEKEIVFIHGVGGGKLKAMIRKILSESYINCQVHDGSYRKYGIDGATHVIIGRFGR